MSSGLQVLSPGPGLAFQKPDFDASIKNEDPTKQNFANDAASKNITKNQNSSKIDFEELHKKSKTEKNQTNNSTQVSAEKDQIRNFIREKMPPWAYGLSSIMHLSTAGILALSGLSKDTQNSITTNVTRFTKLINSIVYSDLAYEALRKGFAFDFLGRIAEPIMNIFADLNHYHLFRAFSSAFSQLHTINLSRVKEGTPLWQNFIDNLEASKDFFMEVWTSKGGKLNEKFGGGPKDKGHTLALASHVQIAVGILALLNGMKRNMTNRVIGVIRNIIGVVADIGLLFEKDFSARRCGMFYLAHAVGDTIKLLLPKNTQDVIDNAIMPFYNGALYYFGLMGRRQTDGTYMSYDTPATLAA